MQAEIDQIITEKSELEAKLNEIRASAGTEREETAQKLQAGKEEAVKRSEAEREELVKARDEASTAKEDIETARKRLEDELGVRLHPRLPASLTVEFFSGSNETEPDTSQ